MAKKNNNNLVDGKYGIRDLVDVDRLRDICERFSRAVNCAVGFVSYPEQENLVYAQWTNICTKFHRMNTESAACCVKSNTILTRKMTKVGDMGIEECGNGLIDGGTPIIIKGKHVATLFVGQVFFKPPDIERFKRQAALYGFDLEPYLKAVKSVPVIDEERFKAILSSLGGIASVITELGYHNLDIKKKNEELSNEVTERKKIEKSLLLREYQLEVLTRTSQTMNTVLEVSAIMRTLTKAAIDLVGGTSGLAGLYIGNKMIFTEYCKDGRFKPINKTVAPIGGVLGWIASKKKPYISNDIARDIRAAEELRETPGLYNLIGVPIVGYRGELLGYFRIDNKIDRKRFDVQDVFMLEGLAASAAVALENAKLLIEHKIAERRIQIMYDELRSRMGGRE